MQLVEGNVYFPRSSVLVLDKFKPSPERYRCPWKCVLPSSSPRYRPRLTGQEQGGTSRITRTTGGTRSRGRTTTSFPKPRPSRASSRSVRLVRPSLPRADLSCGDLRADLELVSAQTRPRTRVRSISLCSLEHCQRGGRRFCSPRRSRGQGRLSRLFRAHRPVGLSLCAAVGPWTDAPCLSAPLKSREQCHVHDLLIHFVRCSIACAVGLSVCVGGRPTTGKRAGWCAWRLACAGLSVVPRRPPDSCLDLADPITAEGTRKAVRPAVGYEIRRRSWQRERRRRAKEACHVESDGKKGRR